MATSSSKSEIVQANTRIQKLKAVIKEKETKLQQAETSITNELIITKKETLMTQYVASLKKTDALVKTLEGKLQKVEKENKHLLKEADRVLSGGSKTGLLKRVFLVYICPTLAVQQLKREVRMSRTEWNVIYPVNKLTYGLSGQYAYGEPTFETMTKICHVINCELVQQKNPLKPSDVLLDWGCGAGLWLIFSSRFFGIDLTCLGFECEQSIFEICAANIIAARRFGLGHKSRVLLAYSQTFETFKPARIVVNYDGGAQRFQRTKSSRVHLNIMRTAFCSPSVDVIVSSKLILTCLLHILGIISKSWEGVFGSQL